MFECVPFCIITGNRISMKRVSECGTSDSQNSDLLLANIEKFILEYHQGNNMTAKPLTGDKTDKGKLYDTENLLDILEEENKVPNRKSPISVPTNPKKQPILPFKRKIEDETKSSVLRGDLPPVNHTKNSLDKLGEKNKLPTRKPQISVPATLKKQPILPFKRKIGDKTESDFPPTKIKSIKPQQKIENASCNTSISNSLKCRTTQLTPARPIPIRKKGRPKRQQEQYAKTKIIKEVKFETPKPIMPSSKRKAFITTHPCRTHRYKAMFADIRKDSRTVKNIIIKQEVIDLTSDDVSLKLVIKFPREEFVPERKYHTCDILLTEKPIRIRPFIDLYTAKVLKADIHVHLIETVIDLTMENDESNSIIVASEKECAIKILPSLYKFHQASQLNRVMEGALDEIDGEQTFNFSSRHTKTIALTLIETISGLYVKNFKIESFLEFLTYKFNQKYKVSISMNGLAHYLQAMLVNLNRQHCNNQFIIKFAKEIDKVVRIKREIEESDTSCDYVIGFEDEVVFTEMQLEQLRYQIHQYTLIVKYNQYLTSSYLPSELEGEYEMNRNQVDTTSIPANEAQREIKDEILEFKV